MMLLCNDDENKSEQHHMGSWNVAFREAKGSMPKMQRGNVSAKHKISLRPLLASTNNSVSLITLSGTRHMQAFLLCKQFVRT